MTSATASASPPRGGQNWQRSAFNFFTRENLRISDLDQNQHVNNIAYLVLFENVRNQFIVQRTPFVRSEDFTYMLLHLDIDFAGELHYPGHVDAACRVEEVRRSTVVFSQAVFDGDRVAATGHAVVANIDRRLRRAVPFEEEARAKFDPVRPAPTEEQKL